MSRQTGAQTLGGPFVSRKGRASIGRVVAGPQRPKGRETRVSVPRSRGQGGQGGGHTMVSGKSGRSRSEDQISTQSRGWQPGESRSDRLVRPARICARAPHKAESLTGTPLVLISPVESSRPPAGPPVGHPSPATGPGCSHVLASRQPVRPPTCHHIDRGWTSRGLHTPALPTGRT